MKEIRNLIESSEEFRIQGNAVAAHLKLLDAVRALAARVEALEQRKGFSAKVCCVCGEAKPELQYPEPTVFSPVCIQCAVAKPASGGPKREAIPGDTIHMDPATGRYWVERKTR